ncbi:MAG: NADH-quinone oxidoreductase subunit C [Alphaproteobacteria bacterium]|nr:NADH-quinone oxidoreductase subunit C [Alphaproteobacteria bacterium]
MTETNQLLRLLKEFPLAETHRPWARRIVDFEAWQGSIDLLAVSDWDFLGLWAEPQATDKEKFQVHMALRDGENTTVVVVTLPLEGLSYPAVSTVRPGALRLERSIADLFGLIALGAEDMRPWLDHGRWPVNHPLSEAEPREIAPFDYDFLKAESAEALHQIPVGPVHAGIIEPGHFRFHANGEAVVRLETRLGYVHKGIEALMQGKTLLEASKLAGRVSGDSTVAYAYAFARACEAACDVEAPPRAVWLRAVMAEIERLANHLGDFGAVCNDAAYGIMLAHAMTLKEKVLRAANKAFGHRLMMDCIIPGGVAHDLGKEGMAQIKAMQREVRRGFERLAQLYDDTPSLLDRTVGTGVTMASLAHRFGTGGVIARASGRSIDARRNPGYAPYDELDFDVPLEIDGDVHCRLMVRMAEIRESLALIERFTDGLPSGPLTRPLPAQEGEGMALVEGFRGEILVWVRIDGSGRILRCFPRDPSWFQWPLLEACIDGNIVADFPLCNKSFNCSYSGSDL